MQTIINAPYVDVSPYGHHYLSAHEQFSRDMTNIETLEMPEDASLLAVKFTGVIVRVYQGEMPYREEIARALVPATMGILPNGKHIDISPTQDRIDAAIDRVCAAAGIPE